MNYPTKNVYVNCTTKCLASATGLKVSNLQIDFCNSTSTVNITLLNFPFGTPSDYTFYYVLGGYNYSRLVGNCTIAGSVVSFTLDPYTCAGSEKIEIWCKDTELALLAQFSVSYTSTIFCCESHSESSSSSSIDSSSSSSSSNSSSSVSSNSSSSNSSSSSVDTIYVCGEGIVPDCTGSCNLSGTYNGQNAYTDGALWIWFESVMFPLKWYISATKGDGVESWRSNVSGVSGLLSLYSPTPGSSYLGNPTVQQTPCDEMSSSSSSSIDSSSSSSSYSSDSSNSSSSLSSNSSSSNSSSSSESLITTYHSDAGFSHEAFDEPLANNTFTYSGDYGGYPYYASTLSDYLLFFDVYGDYGYIGQWLIIDNIGYSVLYQKVSSPAVVTGQYKTIPGGVAEGNITT